MVRRALTLFELMIVIALIGAIVMIVLPATWRQLVRNALDAAQDQLQGQALLIRAHAMSTGETLEWRYNVQRRTTEARRFATDDLALALRAASDVAAAGPAGPSDNPGDDALLAPPDGLQDPLGSWAFIELPRGLYLTDAPPSELFDAFDSVLGGPNEDEWERDESLDPILDDDSGDQMIRLGVFLPDGSVLLTRSVWLHDAEREILRLQVNEWTGQISFTRVTPVTGIDSRDSMSDEEPAARDDDGESLDSPASSGSNPPSNNGGGGGNSR